MVQTFMTHSDFEDVASCLDLSRLRKQVPECTQIIRAVEARILKGFLDSKQVYWQDFKAKIMTLDPLKAEINNKGQKRIVGYQNHPVTKLWEHNPEALKLYKWCMFKELVKRLHNYDVIIINNKFNLTKINMPSWIYDYKVLSDYRKILLKKDYGHYSKFGWK